MYVLDAILLLIKFYRVWARFIFLHVILSLLSCERKKTVSFLVFQPSHTLFDYA